MGSAGSRELRVWLWLLLMTVWPLSAGADQEASEGAGLVALGRSLFHDVRLSADGSVACASCHDAQRAWSDARPTSLQSGVSSGVAGRSGRRNAPVLSYAALVPALQPQPDGSFSGGLFWDGRAATLEAQAAGPLFHPDEMGLRDAAELQQKLLASADHVAAFSTLFGADCLQAADCALEATGSALAAYQRSPEFVAFDSRYDRYLRGEYRPTKLEQLGMGMFFSPQFTNCSSCHQLQPLPQRRQELFSNLQYENIGVPANPRLAPGAPDAGLGAAGGGAPGLAQQGRFRVPTLRNVAVSGPYMHNGVFMELETVLLFYNRYLQRGDKGMINPETGEEWGAPEVADNLALDKLRQGLAQDEGGLEALAAFLRMLTDSRFETEQPAAAPSGPQQLQRLK